MTEENIIVDALPYIDKGYDAAGVRAAAALLVEEEMKRYRPTKNYLEHLPTLKGPLQIKFETEIMKNEFERLSNRLPMEILSMKRYELPPPPAGKSTDLKAWQESLFNAQAQLEHQATRIENLKLMCDYGCNAWKSFNVVLESTLKKYEKDLLTLKKQIQELNWQRKQEQSHAGQRLQLLEEEWVTLVGKNYDIERTIIEMERSLPVE